MLTAQEIIALLGLQPLPFEGGFYRETYRAAETLSAEVLPSRYGRPKSLGTAIYYLLTPETASGLHRLPTDEIFHFYLGDPVEMLLLYEEGQGALLTLGNDLSAGHRPQVIVPAGVWQGSRLHPGGRLALLGTTMAPGFDLADFEPGVTPLLAAAYPHYSQQIEALRLPPPSE